MHQMLRCLLVASSVFISSLSSNASANTVSISLTPNVTTLGATGGVVNFIVDLSVSDPNLDMYGFTLLFDISNVNFQNPGISPVALSNFTIVDGFSGLYFVPEVPGSVPTSDFIISDFDNTTGKKSLKYSFDATFAANTGSNDKDYAFSFLLTDPYFEVNVFDSNFNVAQFSIVDTPATITVSAPSVTTPVPEAETYAMLMLGLGLISAAALRRKH